MYYDYFGLNQPPFRITPDTSLFFPGGNRGAVLEAMIYAITSGEGIVKVVGEVGSGKTMLCRMLSVELPENVEVVYLANPNLSPDNILHAIAFELKLDVAPDDDRLQVMNKLQDFLLERHAQNQQVVVFVEEAQSMPLATLEEIRLLSNLETRQNKLLQIVLFGQPELDQMIAKKEIRQLKERITYSFYLNPLKQEEIRDYLNTRLRACGYRANDPFSKSAVRAISRFSKGLIRRINILADKAMLAAYAGNLHTVSAKHVRAAARDSEFIVLWQRYSRAFGIACVLVLLLLAVLLLPGRQHLYSYLDETGGETAPPAAASSEKSTRIVDPVEEPAKEVPADREPDMDIATIYQPQDSSHYFDYFSAGRLEAAVPAQDERNILIAEPVHKGDDTTDNTQPLPAQGKVETTEQAPVLSAQEQLAEMVAVAMPGLSPEQLAELVNQFRQLPPETQVIADGNACDLCSSFIYRPLKMNDYL